MVGALCSCWFRLGGAHLLIPFGPVSLPGYGSRPVARGRAIFTPPLAPGQSPAEEADAGAASVRVRACCVCARVVCARRVCVCSWGSGCMCTLVCLRGVRQCVSARLYWWGECVR